MSRNRQPVGEGPGLGAGPGRGEGGSQCRGGERSEPPRNGDPPSPRLMRQGEDSFVQTGRPSAERPDPEVRERPVRRRFAARAMPSRASRASDDALAAHQPGALAKDEPRPLLACGDSSRRCGLPPPPKTPNHRLISSSARR